MPEVGFMARLVAALRPRPVAVESWVESPETELEIRQATPAEPLRATRPACRRIGLPYAGGSLDPNRQAYRPNLRRVRLVCRAPDALQVSVVGDFNDWNPSAHPMTQAPDQSWTVALDLRHGSHAYAFMVDGVLCLDPQAQGTVRTPQGERRSLVTVS